MGPGAYRHDVAVVGARTDSGDAMRHGVTEQDYRRAGDLGSTARRAGKGVDVNPHKNDWSDRGYLLSSAWEAGWASEDEQRARK